MNLGQSVNTSRLTSAPWVFTLETILDPRSMSDKDILNHSAYCAAIKDLTKKLFKTQKMLHDSLQGGLSVQWCEMTLEHFDLGGRFDHAICKLSLTNRGPTRFLLETRFFLTQSLVTIATQEGILYFDELN
jgi:hypothetical protein